MFWLGRRHLGSERTAGLLALAYLASPWLAWTALDAMHPVTLAIPLFLYGIWFLDTGRVLPFLLCAVLVLATGELMGLPFAGLGIWYWLSRGERRVGLAIAVAGVAWTALCLKVIVPAARGEASPFYDRFASVGGSPGGIVKTAFADPGAIVSALFTGNDALYVVFLALPLAGAFLLSPLLAAVALPQLLVNALSDWDATTDPRHHYIAGVLPFLVAAMILGIARLPARRRTQAAVATSRCCRSSPSRSGRGRALQRRSRDASTRRCRARMSRHCGTRLRSSRTTRPATATNAAGSQLSARRHFYSVPAPPTRAEWILL